ncbi:MAG: HEAT repeat domain-containing protein [Candidatus Coatesbacteria bacterium]|nr:HEAT repeat domain-containing protein [Candidatus Coatesbacteria bacterium]
MLRRWMIVIGIGVIACFVVAIAAFSLRLETAESPSKSSPQPAIPSVPTKQLAPREESTKPIIRLDHSKAQLVGGVEREMPTDPSLDGLSAEELIDLLNSKDNEKTKSAARKLESMASDAVPALIKRLSETFTNDGKFNKLRWWCVNTLGNIKDERATDVLVKCAALDSDPHTRWRSIWALNVIREDRRIDLLREYLSSDDVVVRFNAATALSTMDVDDGVKVIEEATKSSDHWLRWQAVSALGKIKSPETLRILATCLKDPSDGIRQEAAMSLGRLDDPNAIPHLVEALSDEKSGVRWRAARSLGQLNAKSAIPELKKLLDDPDGSVRGQTAVALGEVGCKDRDVAAKVIGILSDPDRDVRSKAAMAIGKIGGREDIDVITKLLESEKEDRVSRRLERSLQALKAQGGLSSHEPTQDQRHLIPISEAA